MLCVNKPSSTHGIIVSLWLICYIQCEFSTSYLSILGIVAHDRCNISHYFTFSFHFQCPLSCCVFHLYNCFSGVLKAGQRVRKVGRQWCGVIIICFKTFACLISRTMGCFFVSPLSMGRIKCFFIFVFVLLSLLLLILLLVVVLILFLLSLLLLLLLSSILVVNLCINVLYPLIFFFMPQVKDQQSTITFSAINFGHSIFVTTIFRLIVFRFHDFVVLLQNH